jgi:hypothetical protein
MNSVFLDRKESGSHCLGGHPGGVPLAYEVLTGIPRTYLPKALHPCNPGSSCTCLDRFEVNVIEVRVIIPLILERMLPKSSLPNTPFVFHLPSGC